MAWPKDMLILNYKPILRKPTGIGVYANSILPAFDGFEHVLIPGGGSGVGKERLNRLAWSQLQLPRLAKEHKADLIFTPAPEGYLGKQVVPQVVMVHDLRPLSHPERSVQSLYFRTWVPALLRQCSYILTNSNYTASEIIRRTGVPEEKISVTPLGYNEDYFYPSDLKRRFHHRPYLLNVGQAYPHKNLQMLIRVFASISNSYPELDLILLGKPHPFESARLLRLVSELNLSDRIFFKSYVPFKDLPDWYRGARALVYPSLWEGFGLPIIEAMACGCPVITSLGSGMEEVAGSAALLVNPNSFVDLREVLVQFLLGSTTTAELRSKGLERASSFSWNKTRACVANSIQTALTVVNKSSLTT